MPSNVIRRDVLDDGSLNGVLINKIRIHGIQQYFLKCLQVDASSSLSFLFTNDEKLIFEYDNNNNNKSVKTTFKEEAPVT